MPLSSLASSPKLPATNDHICQNRTGIRRPKVPADMSTEDYLPPTRLTAGLEGDPDRRRSGSWPAFLGACTCSCGGGPKFGVRGGSTILVYRSHPIGRGFCRPSSGPLSRFHSSGPFPESLEKEETRDRSMATFLPILAPFLVMRLCSDTSTMTITGLSLRVVTHCPPTDAVVLVEQRRLDHDVNDISLAWHRDNKAGPPTPHFLHSAPRRTSSQEVRPVRDHPSARRTIPYVPLKDIVVPKRAGKPSEAQLAAGLLQAIKEDHNGSLEALCSTTRTAPRPRGK